VEARDDQPENDPTLSGPSLQAEGVLGVMKDEPEELPNIPMKHSLFDGVNASIET